jgi:hypothetical protein
LTVIQPRIAAEPKTQALSAAVLLDWQRQMLHPAVARIEAGDTTEKSGSWCRWCIRKNECHAFAVHQGSIASEIFDDGVDPSR